MSNLGTEIDLETWFQEIKPLIDWKKLSLRVPDLLDLLHSEGLNNQEIFALCYGVSRFALERDFKT